MKNILNEELNQIKYLFGYKKGVVISEQTAVSNAVINAQASIKNAIIDEFKIKYELSKLGGESGQEIQNYYKSKIDGGNPEQPEQRYLELINTQYSKLTPDQKNKFLASYNSERTTGETTVTPIEGDKKYNFPQLKDDVEKYEDSIMTTAPQNIKDSLNEDRDNRSVGVATSSDPNIAKSKAFVKGQVNLAKKLGVNEIKAVRVIDATQDGQTYVVVAKA